MSKKMIYCGWCGEELGIGEVSAGDGPESCGKAECNREVRQLHAQEESERQERAKEDNYERY